MTIIEGHWPWLIPIIASAMVVAYLAKAGPAIKSFGSAMLRFVNRDRKRIDAELADLRRQVQYLTRQVSDLRSRDEMSWEWVLTDQAWHRDLELLAAEKGWDIPPHISYMEFREEWLKSHKTYEPLAP